MDHHQQQGTTTMNETMNKNQSSTDPTTKVNGFWKKYGIWCIVGAVLVVFVILIVVVSKVTDSGRMDSNGDQIQSLLRDTKRYYDLATQDKDPIVAYAHANYAWMTIRILKQMYSDSDISRVENPQIVKRWLIETDSLQDQLSKRLSASGSVLFKPVPVQTKGGR